MNWILSFIVFQCAILLLQGRPETSTSSMPENITLEMEYPSSVSEILTTLESGPPPQIVSADIKKHLSTNVAAPAPSQTIKRVMSTIQSRKNEPIKKATKAPEIISSTTSNTFSTTSNDMDFIAKTTRLIEEINAKQKSQVTTTPKADPVKTTTVNAEKPTIYDIITETEKNQTIFASRAQQQSISSSTVSPPMSLPLSSSMPIQNQRSGDTPKAIGHHIEMHQNGHPGIAEPLTWQEIESEMSMVDQNLKDSSTSKDGISTWILLSGSDKQPSMVATPATTTIAHVEKVNIKDDRHNYRFGEMNGDKIIKPIKSRDSIDKKPKPEKKNKLTPSSTVMPKTTPQQSTTSGILVASDFMSTEKNRRKGPTVVKVNDHKLKRKSSTTTTAEPIISHVKVDKFTTAEIIETTTPVSFIVLEPKIAGFDLPQDRSPGIAATKKPLKNNGSKNKRKPSKKNKVTSVTKTPAKNKDKPIATTIYNYISREVMPSVGILSAGILLTGIASYFLSPFGVLRRSYDDATDRQDNVENIYSVNNEEYASAGSDSGQHEEEVFSKFLAGMPYRDVPRYVKYFKPDHPQPKQATPMGPYRQQVRIQPQASNVVPNYSPYMRYRTAPSPHYNSAQYNPQQSYPTYRNHQMSTQAAAQPQPASPVYNPQYHEIQKQKSFANNMDTILKHQNIIYGKSPSENVIEEKSIRSDIQAESDNEQLPQTEGQLSDMNENETMEDVSAQIQRRTNTYVVGSAITDTQPGEAVVSASMTASIDGLPSKGIVEPVITVTSSSHGPRRRRRRDIDAVYKIQKLSNKTIEHETQTTSSPSTTKTMAPQTHSSRLYSVTEYSNLVAEYNMLREKFMSFDRDYSNAENEKKVEKKLQTEYKSISTDYDALKKAVDGANAIETFEKQVRIRAKNYELSVVLKTGIATLRQRIKILNELIEHPEDVRIIEKINRRNGSSETGPTSNSTISTTITPELDNGFVGFLKLLQLKAQFGLNILQNIRPSFERAFEEVFKRPYEKPN